MTRSTSRSGALFLGWPEAGPFQSLPHRDANFVGKIAGVHSAQEYKLRAKRRTQPQQKRLALVSAAAALTPLAPYDAPVVFKVKPPGKGVGHPRLCYCTPAV